MEKPELTKYFKCLRPATGQLLPLFSHGFLACLSPPCTDEPRISLCPNDIIKVSRFRKHWLFGEIILIDGEVKDVANHRKGPIRGWFPRRCAAELFELEVSVCASKLNEAGGDNGDNLNESRSHALNGVSGNSNKSLSNDNSPTNVKQQNGGHRKKNN